MGPLIDPDRAQGLWAATAPPAPATPPLQGELEVDLAVVGAGFTGLAAALHAAGRGAAVAVLEAGEIGAGASGRNVGLVNAGLWAAPAVVERTLGPVHGPRLAALLGEAPSLVFDLVARHGIDCEAVRAGTLHCAAGSRGLRALALRCRQLQAAGAPVEWLDRSETARRTGTPAYAAALFDPRAGTVQPLAYARGLARAAIAAGARVCTATPVIAVDDLGTRWRLATAGGGSVIARRVVVATNAYSRGPWGALTTEIARLPYFNLATAPLDGARLASILPGGEGAWDTRRLLSSFRRDAAGRLVFGSVGALEGGAARTHLEWGRRALARLFPQLGAAAFTHAWFGWLGMTADALPRLHRLARDTWSLSGYNGRGIAPGTALGRELARLALGEVDERALPLPLTDLAVLPLRAVREAVYAAGSRLGHALGARR